MAHIVHFFNVFPVLVVEHSLLDCVPQPEQVACCYGDAHTNKPTKRDGRVVHLISTLHNADKASAGYAIG